MKRSHIQINVGIFLILGLALLAGLTILFSRSTPFYRDYYELRLRSGNVGGIVRGAKVFMRGVPVGYVGDIQLNEGGQSVTIQLQIESRYTLYSDARFMIEQAGFLGDQFVAIYPDEDQGYVLTNQAEVVARDPFNLQEAVAVATATISKIDQAATNLNAALTDVRRLVLTEDKLANVGAALDRMNGLMIEAEEAMNGLKLIVTNNADSVAAAVSNLNLFTSKLPPVADQVQSLIQSNEAGLSAALHNLETSSIALTNLMSDLEHGDGAAGKLLRDEQLAANLSSIASNLAITTSNLNVRGLWGILWKQKPAKTDD